jgi:uracil-DNA glycosylase
MHQSWKAVLADEFQKPYFRRVADFVKAERQKGVVFPPPGQVFRAFEVTPYDQVKVCILGQDPYHNAEQAHGLSFSVQRGVQPPPSLVNIFKELKADLGCEPPKHGDLTHWAQQGVFLLNAVLTVKAHQPGSHQNQGWEKFTDAVISKLNEREDALVFVLWGRYARNKARLIDESTHLVVESPHPSPMSANSGFFGSRPFSQINAGLEELGHEPIDWQLPE